MDILQTEHSDVRGLEANALEAARCADVKEPQRLVS